MGHMWPMDAKVTKVSATEPTKFRAGEELAGLMNSLQDEIIARGGSIKISRIVREGLLGCWPQVRTHLLVRHTTPVAQADAVARLVAICSKAIEHGVTPDQIEATLDAQLEKNLTPTGV